MVLNSKGQLTIPAHLREKYGLHPGDEEVEAIEVDGALRIVRAAGAETQGQRMPGGCATRPPARTWRHEHRRDHGAVAR